MKYVLVLILLFTFTFSNTNRITTSDGITCESTNNEPYEVESYVESNKNDLEGSYTNEQETINDNSTLFGVRFVYRFGGQKPLNCNRLYNLELREKEAKVKELEAKIKALENASKIDWENIDEK